MKAAEKRKLFVERILEWHRTHKRNLPWRKTRDPYAILVAEMLLRRTTARQVANVYEFFMEKYPTPSALVRAPTEKVEEVIAPLGLRGRAKHLKEVALRIETSHGGKVPRSAEELLALPGVGRYAANAVLCFAFGEDLPVVDDSVIRVMRRVFSLKALTSSPQQDPTIWGFMARLIPRGRAREFNWGLLDFAAELCIAKSPRHEACFMTDTCDYYQEKIKTRGV